MASRYALSSQPHATASLSLCTTYPDTHGVFSPVQGFKLSVQTPKSNTFVQADWCLREALVCFSLCLLGRGAPKWKQARAHSLQSSLPACHSSSPQLSQVLEEWCWCQRVCGILHLDFFLKESVNKANQVERIHWRLAFKTYRLKDSASPGHWRGVLVTYMAERHGKMNAYCIVIDTTGYWHSFHSV